MKQVTQKHLGRLYYNKYTHMVQLEHVLFPKYELRSLLRGYARNSTIDWVSYLTTRFDQMRQYVNRYDNITINYRGEFERDSRIPRHVSDPNIEIKDIDSAEKLINFLISNRSRFDVGTVRAEHRRISFFSSSSVMQDELLANFSEHVVCIGKPDSDTHKQALIDHAAENSVVRKIVCRKRLKNDRYRFSLELKRVRDLYLNDTALSSMIKDMVDQNSCVPNANLRVLINNSHTIASPFSQYHVCYYRNSRLWFEDDSDLGLLLLALGNTYIRCIEEYRVVT